MTDIKPAAVQRQEALAVAIRRARGSLSPAELANRAGVTKGDYLLWEDGSSAPTLEQLYCIEEAVQARHGLLAEAAGYATCEAMTTSMHVYNFEGLLECLRAAERLHLRYSVEILEDEPEPDGSVASCWALNFGAWLDVDGEAVNHVEF